MVCVPVVEKRREAITHRILELAAAGAAMVEWRMDWFAQVEEPGAAAALVGELTGRLEHTLLLCTYRSEAQGGRGRLAASAYEKLNLEVAESGGADLVDLEFYQAADPRRQIMQLREAGVWVVCSSHDFDKTPSQAEMERQLWEMASAGADFAKLAVMPQGRKEVLGLMAAVVAVKERLPESHLIAMSMGETGALSRLLGGWYGSEVTFASAGAASAPGQIPWERAAELLKELEEYC